MDTFEKYSVLQFLTWIQMKYVLWLTLSITPFVRICGCPSLPFSQIWFLLFSFGTGFYITYIQRSNEFY